MINGKHVDMDFIMEKVKKDLPPSIEINEEDIVEFTWEALAKIGAPNTYITLYSILDVNNYRAKLPGWLHNLKEVRFITHDELNITDENTINNIPRYSYKMATVTDSFDISTNVNNVGEKQGHRYIIKSNYIHTTFEKGAIEIAYESMPIDTDGRPLVPDDIYYIEAVKWYIIKSYLWRVSMRDTTFYSIYQVADSEWKFYVNSASNKAKIPNRDGLHALMDKFLRIVPNLHRNVRYTYYRSPEYTREDTNNIFVNL